jgi:NAD(P)H-dependent nitrite reductase small subunit
MGEFVKVAKKSEIPADTGKYVEVKGREIALFKIGDKVYAIDHICAHQGGPLAEGGLEEKVVTCPWHGWSYDVTTGVCTFNEAIKQQTFSVKEEGDDILVEVG